tara:strand:- start:123 stop:557 length:435 start_codon:yes stop_codon:yes gene_type:complete
MATINTDIAQKIDIIARQHDTMTITLNMSTSTGSVYGLTDTYILFNVYNGETESSLIMYSNAVSTSGTLYNTFTAAGITMYDSFLTDTYTTYDTDGITLNTTTGVVTIRDANLGLIPGGYKYKLIIQSLTSTKTWMYGNFKVNE